MNTSRPQYYFSLVVLLVVGAASVLLGLGKSVDAPDETLIISTACRTRRAEFCRRISSQESVVPREFLREDLTDYSVDQRWRQVSTHYFAVTHFNQGLYPRTWETILSIPARSADSAASLLRLIRISSATLQLLLPTIAVSLALRIGAKNLALVLMALLTWSFAFSWLGSPHPSGVALTILPAAVALVWIGSEKLNSGRLVSGGIVLGVAVAALLIGATRWELYATSLGGLAMTVLVLARHVYRYRARVSSLVLSSVALLATIASASTVLLSSGISESNVPPTHFVSEAVSGVRDLGTTILRAGEIWPWPSETAQPRGELGGDARLRTRPLAFALRLSDLARERNQFSMTTRRLALSLNALALMALICGAHWWIPRGPVRLVSVPTAISLLLLFMQDSEEFADAAARYAGPAIAVLLVVGWLPTSGLSGERRDTLASRVRSQLPAVALALLSVDTALMVVGEALGIT